MHWAYKQSKDKAVLACWIYTGAKLNRAHCINSPKTHCISSSPNRRASLTTTTTSLPCWAQMHRSLHDARELHLVKEKFIIKEAKTKQNKVYNCNKTCCLSRHYLWQLAKAGKSVFSTGKNSISSTFLLNADELSVIFSKFLNAGQLTAVPLLFKNKIQSYIPLMTLSTLIPLLKGNLQLFFPCK